MAKCLCDEGRVVKSCRVDLDSKVSIYTCICTHTRIVPCCGCMLCGIRRDETLERFL